MKNIWYWLNNIILLFAIYGTGGLVVEEFSVGNICPKLLGIPACYVVLFCFVLGLISHWAKGKRNLTIYYFFIGIVTTIALVGTIGEITGLTKCPRTSSGIPMCFISLSICISLLFSKVMDNKKAYKYL